MERTASDTTVSDDSGLNGSSSEATSTAAHAQPPRPKGKPGKLPTGPQKADSREAAADVLRKFFHRR
jgi:hypothetical protein